MEVMAVYLISRCLACPQVPTQIMPQYVLCVAIFMVAILEKFLTVSEQIFRIESVHDSDHKGVVRSFACLF